MVAFDIIRVDENGKVAEHWDAMTELAKETASGRSHTDGPTTATDLDKTEKNKALARSMVEDTFLELSNSGNLNLVFYALRCFLAHLRNVRFLEHVNGHIAVI